MKPYVITAGAIFGVVTLVHLSRFYAEPQLARDPWFVMVTVATGLMALWAWRLRGSK